MSDDHQHDSPIKTPKQLMAVVALSFIVPIALIVFLTQYVTGGKHGGESEAAKSAAGSTAISQRIAPVGTVVVKDSSGPRVYLTGEALVTQVCAACHATGAAGAPKVGDKAAWTARLGQGFDGLLASVIKGKGAMPPRAGTLPDDVSDYELQRAVVYMANASGASFKEPAAPAPAATADAAGAATTAAAPTAAAAPAAAPAAPAPAPAAAPAATPAAAAPAAAAPVTAGVGKNIYDTTCQACHGSGLVGAPKFGDKAAWAPRIAQGMAVLYKSAATGKGQMPPRGGSGASDADLKAAVDYMVGAAK